jgi:hypothetical protein
MKSRLSIRPTNHLNLVVCISTQNNLEIFPYNKAIMSWKVAKVGHNYCTLNVNSYVSSFNLG